MAKKGSMRKAFTLIEVMVSVMIIVTVVMALYSMNANSSMIYEKSKKDGSLHQYNSLLVGNLKYGFEDDNIELDRLIDDFDVDDELRRELHKQKVKIIYTEVRTIYLSEFSLEDEAESENSNIIYPQNVINDQKKENANSGFVFEIGRDSLKFEEGSSSILRLRLL